jgi:hypothetical protein
MAARLILIHSPLVGPASWELVAADLAGRGYEVSVPDLTGTVAAEHQETAHARPSRGPRWPRTYG